MAHQSKAGKAWEDPAIYIIVAALLAVVTAFLWKSNSRLDETLLSDSIITMPAAQDGIPYISAQLQLSHMRYRQASFALYSKSVRRNAGFLVGAMMVLIGGVFIVRRLEAAVDLAGGGPNNLAAQLKTSSPGIVMAFFGTVVLGITLLAQEPVVVEDVGLAPEFSAPPVRAASGDAEEALRNSAEDARRLLEGR